MGKYRHCRWRRVVPETSVKRRVNPIAGRRVRDMNLEESFGANGIPRFSRDERVFERVFLEGLRQSV